MPDVKRQLRIVTTQKVNPNKPPLDPGDGSAPLATRDWTVEVYLINENDPSGTALVAANCLEKVTYHLHPTFGKRATQAFKNTPFKIVEEGWGEFDMTLSLTPVGSQGKSNDMSITHDLNFQYGDKYEATHKLTFKNPKGDLLALLRESGPIPGEESIATAAAASTVAAPNGAARATPKEPPAKKKRSSRHVDMEKLAEALQRLTEDDLIHVVQLVHDNKSSETYTKNDVENGEFHVDLYTLPDALVKMLWDFTSEKGVLV